jgi:xylulokinase
MGEIFCGIDIGTTNLKVALVDGAAARTVWVDTVATPRVSDGIGPVTDAAALLAAIEAMIVRGWREVGGGRPIAAIATAGVGEDGLGLDGDLVPTGHALPWFDMRAEAEAAALQMANRHDEDAGISIDPTRTAAKWLWLARHRPEELQASRTWVALTDYPAVAWTGVPFISETLAVRTACYGLAGRAFIPDLLRAANAPPLPPVRVAGSVIGTVGGGLLRESGAATGSTLVVAGGHDHPVAAAAILAGDPARRVDSLGTANLVYAEAPRGTLTHRPPFLAFGAPIRGGGGLACLGVFEFAMALDSFRVDRSALTTLLALPSFPGEPSSFVPAIAVSEDRQVSPRQALEACAFQARAMIEAAVGAGAHDGPIFATGGWARSRALVELRASVFGQPVHTLGEEELTAFGAAMLASEGAGRPLSRAVRFVETVIQPRPEWVELYDALYARWREGMEQGKNRATA